MLNGLFQTDLGTTSSQLTWISDAFLVPVTLFELTFGVLGDLFGRKRLLLFGAGMIVIGELVGALSPGASASTGTRSRFTVSLLFAQDSKSPKGRSLDWPGQFTIQSFYASPAHAPAAQQAKVSAAVQAVKSGPLGQNGVPATVPGPGGHTMPFNPLHTIAFHARSIMPTTSGISCAVRPRRVQDRPFTRSRAR